MSLHIVQHCFQQKIVILYYKSHDAIKNPFLKKKKKISKILPELFQKHNAKLKIGLEISLLPFGLDISHDEFFFFFFFF